MRSKISRSLLIVTTILFFASTAYSQKEFFRSRQVFKKELLDNFYSSVSIYNDLVLFNANDHYLYAYDKNDGTLKWSYETSYKSNIPVFVHDNIVYAGIYSDKEQRSAQLNLSNGNLLKVLPFGPLVTKPVVKNGTLYSTAIYNYGCIIAYDIKRDTVSWSRFVAHGYSRQPYYLKDKILANAEGNNWVELAYDGSLLDTTCKVKPSMFVEGIPCVKNFNAFTHDQREIAGELADDILGEQFEQDPKIITATNVTYTLYEDKLTILGKKLKRTHQVQVSSLAGNPGENDAAAVLVKGDDQYIWILSQHHLLQYDHKKREIITDIDLAAWEPQQVFFDGGNIWLVSKKDGLLYGLSL